MWVKLKRVSGDIYYDDIQELGFPSYNDIHHDLYNCVRIKLETMSDLVKLMDYCNKKYDTVDGVIIHRAYSDDTEVCVTIYDGRVE